MRTKKIQKEINKKQYLNKKRTSSPNQLIQQHQIDQMIHIK